MTKDGLDYGHADSACAKYASARGVELHSWAGVTHSEIVDHGHAWFIGFDATVKETGADGVVECTVTGPSDLPTVSEVGDNGSIAFDSDAARSSSVDDSDRWPPHSRAMRGDERGNRGVSPAGR